MDKRQRERARKEKQLQKERRRVERAAERQKRIDEGGKDVISVRIFERLDKIEKLTKRIREKAKGNTGSIPKID